MRTPLALAAAAALLLARATPAWNDPPPQDYGRVVLDEGATRAGMAPVQFDHWRHRARYTCRLCHVDVGFAMSAGATHVSGDTIRAGFHCGACHDGKHEYRGTRIFAACAPRGKGPPPERCARCHGLGDPEQRRKDFEAFAARAPRRPTTRAIDWEEAEDRWGWKPIDAVEGASLARPPLRMDVDVVIASRGWMTDVLFSHRKHAVWNGCEVCHPEIFPSRAGDVRHTMLEINAGRACGACHGKVAFSLSECDRCHARPLVQAPVPFR